MQIDVFDLSVRILNKCKEINESYKKAYSIGIDLTDFTSGEDLLIDIMASFYLDFDDALSNIHWWLYDNVEKVIYVNKQKIDVSSTEDFVRFLIENK